MYFMRTIISMLQICMFLKPQISSGEMAIVLGTVWEAREEKREESKRTDKSLLKPGQSTTKLRNLKF